MHTLEIEKLPREIYGQLVDDEGLKDQVEKLRTPGGQPSTRKLIDYAERGLIHPPAAGRRGGKNVTRGWFPWAAAQYDAAVRLAAHLPLAQAAEVARLAEIIWANVGNLSELLKHAGEFSGKKVYEQPITFWLSVFSANLKLLYADRLDEERLDYFQSESLKSLVQGLCHGVVEGYTVDKDGALVPPKKRFDPEKPLKKFAGAEPIVDLLAKSPE